MVAFGASFARVGSGVSAGLDSDSTRTQHGLKTDSRRSGAKPAPTMVQRRLGGQSEVPADLCQQPERCPQAEPPFPK
ncbi:MAG: hypothetical protein BGP15_17175 [Sphingobacterium sp. 40-24]|nr:MAG: hypothetical protein BGP15_17175 [Sphingobacterium sp. 40-24]